MNNVNLQIVIEYPITLDCLLKRWRSFEIDGTVINREGIEDLVRLSKITAYDKYYNITDSKYEDFFGIARNSYLGLEPSLPGSSDDDIIFDFAEVKRIEREADEIAHRRMSDLSSQPFTKLSHTNHNFLPPMPNDSKEEINELLLNASTNLTNTEIEPVQQESEKMESEHSTEEAERQLVPVNVPKSLWAGKTAESVYTALESQSFAPAVIAFIIMEKVDNITKTDAGQLFYQNKIAKGSSHENRTYQRKIDRLLKEAKSKYSFTFDD